MNKFFIFFFYEKIIFEPVKIFIFLWLESMVNQRENHSTFINENLQFQKNTLILKCVSERKYHIYSVLCLSLIILLLAVANN